MRIWFTFSPFLFAGLDSTVLLGNAFQTNLPSAHIAPLLPGSMGGISKPTLLYMKNDANNPYNIAAAQLKNMKPEDIDRMIAEMDSMNPIQASALKAMGMDPEMMKKTMKMMRDNPSMIESAQKVMANMTPEQLMEQSKLAQQRMARMSPEELGTMQNAINEIPPEQLDQAAEVLSKQAQEQDNLNDEVSEGKPLDKASQSMETGPDSSSDPAVVDVMFRVAELLSDPPTGGCTFAGFAALPVIQLLKGDRDMDLSAKELKECWADGSLGATRVDRAGFERVWKEVQDYFEDDIMGEARKEAKKKVSRKRRSSSPAPSAPSSNASPAATVGANLSSEQLSAVNERVKNLSSDEMDTMLGMMEKMDPAQEARMKAMGVDPAMMQKTAKMMKENPMMREAAKKMLSNMSPEEMLRTSQQAQKDMAKMSKEQIEKTMEDAEIAAKSNPNFNNLDL